MKVSFNITTVNRTEMRKSKDGGVNYLKNLTQCLRNNDEPLPENLTFNIFDDGSNDKSFIHECVEDFPKVFVHLFPENSGPFASMKRVIEHGVKSEDDWTFIFQDDILLMRNSVPSILKCLESATDNAGLLSFLALYPQAHNKKWNLFPQDKFYCFGCVGLRTKIMKDWLEDKEEQKDSLIRTGENGKGGDIVIPRWICKRALGNWKIYRWGTNFAAHNGRWSTCQHEDKWKELENPEKIKKIEAFRIRDAFNHI